MTSVRSGGATTGRTWRFAVGLFLLAPFVGEFAMGNVPITALPYLLALAPMYGGGAVLIREVARRSGAGWPTMIALAAAYALVEEGPIDQMLMNPHYLAPEGFGAVVPGLGLSAELTASSLAVHTVWSIGVPIAIMEAFDRSAARPWLGRLGLGVVGAVFVVGSLAIAFVNWDRYRFVATPAQFAVVGVLIVALVVVALTVLRRWSPAPRPRAAVAPRPRTVARSALALSTLYWVLAYVVPPVAGGWTQVACVAVLATGSGVLLARASARPGWDRRHRLAVAVGVLSTYLWVSLGQLVLLGLSPVVAVPGWIVVGACSVVLMVLAVRAERRHRREATGTTRLDPAGSS